jgi:hypothetical protein
MWALGVTLYELVTGRHPFNTTDEAAFRDDALTGNVDWAPLEQYPRVRFSLFLLCCCCFFHLITRRIHVRLRSWLYFVL